MLVANLSLDSEHSSKRWACNVHSSVALALEERGRERGKIIEPG